jgi:hypothetical protein
MSAPFTGGCACGAIRYECSAEPLRSVNCHCRDCQKATGSAYYPEILVPKEALRLTKGAPKYYAVKANSGTTLNRGFCSECGCPVLILIGDLPFSSIAIGSLDDPSWYRPEMDIFTSRAHPWDVMNPELPKFPEMPPQLLIAEDR